MMGIVKATRNVIHLGQAQPSSTCAKIGKEAKEKLTHTVPGANH